MKIEKLCEPIKIGNLVLPNRIKMPSIASGLAKDGMVSDELLAFYRERARGGAGIVGICLCPTEQMGDPWLEAWDDKFIPGLKKLVKMFHDNGCLVYAQIISGFAWRFPGRELEFVSPSGISVTGRVDPPYRLGGPKRGTATIRRELTKDEIHHIIQAFGDAAVRAREAGFDACEQGNVTGSYATGQFASPLVNKRTDEYGGSFENRMRLAMETADVLMEKGGKDWTYTARLIAQFTDNAIMIPELTKIAQMLEKKGFAAVDMCSGQHEDPVEMIQSFVPQGAWVYLAEGIKKGLKIPVGAGTNIADVEVAEKALQEGRADYIYMARALIADPELPRKVMEGRIKDIRPCIACCRCYETAVHEEIGLFCSANPETGRAAKYQITPAAKPKKVAVIGAGPAGLQTARVAASRGHEVVLYDEKPRAGGATLLASVINERIEKLNKWYQGQVRKWPIKEIKLGTKVTRELLEQSKPDIIVIAGGGKSPDLGIPIDSPNVINSSEVQQLLGGKIVKRGGPVGRLMWALGAFLLKYWYNPAFIRWFMKLPFPFKKRTIIIGGEFAGCEMGEFLLRKGKEITIIEEGKRLGVDIGPVTRWAMLTRIRKGKSKIVTEAKVEEITSKGVRVSQDGNSIFLEGDTVLLAKGLNPNPESAKSITGETVTIHIIGDCNMPGKIMEAQADGFILGSSI